MAAKPNDAEVALRYGYLRKVQERFEEAIPYFESAVKKDPRHPIIHYEIGYASYQLGRFESGSFRRPEGERFSDGMRKLYYDTVLYTKEALELLIKVVGVDQCLFGAECPGVGSSINPDTDRHMDDVAPHIREIEWLSEADKKKILEDNSKRVFKLDV